MFKGSLIRFDWAVKRLLRQKSNFDILEGFLSTLFDDDIKILRILESESNRERKDDKSNQVDVLAETGKGELIIIEVQNTRERDYFHRILYGVSKTITEYIDIGAKYHNVRKIYSISIVYFGLGQGKDYVYFGRTEFRGIHEHDVLQLSNNQQKRFVCQNAGDLFPEYYIIRVDDFDKKAVSKLDEWIYFLKTGEIPENASAKGLAEAKERLKYASLSKEEQRIYLEYMESVRRHNSMSEGTFLDGKEEGKIEIARNALKMGLSIENIIQLTGLTKEDLDKISI